MAKIRPRRKEYELNERAVDAISDEVNDICEEIGASLKDTVRYRLSVEECLLKWLEDVGAGAKTVITTGTSLMTPVLEVSCEGKRVDPLANDSEDFGSYGATLMTNLGLSPGYSYSDGANRISYKLKKRRMSQITVLGAVLLLAVIVGVLGLNFIPDGIRDTISAGLITPVYDTFFNIIGMIAGPMIFLSVVFGIYGSGDAQTFGRIGKKMMLTYCAMAFLGCMSGLVWAPVIGPGIASSASGKSQFAEIVDMILGIIPGNIIEPFAEGNTLQIIFLAIMVGLGLLFLGKQVRSISHAVEQLNALVQFLMSVVCRFVPYFIFFIVVNLIWTGSYGDLAKLWKVVLFLVLGGALTFTVYLLYTSLMAKVSPVKLVRKMLPTYMIALTTASSAASFETNCKTCREGYGIDSSMVSFGIPLGMVMQKMTSAMYFLIIVLFFARVYGLNCSLSWYLMAVIVCATMSIAMPPVPGGAAASYAILFAQLGVPAEVLPIVLAIDMFTDFFLTSADMVCIQLSMINVARRIGAMDADVLRK